MDAGSLAPKVTTLLVTNIPNYLTQGALLSMFEDLNCAMRGNFDFFFCPWDEKVGHNLGYAIINFPGADDAAAFQQSWSNKELCKGGRGQKSLRVIKAALQGLQANLEYFSMVEVTECTDPRFRPLFRDSSGLLQPLQLDTGSAASPAQRSATIALPELPASTPSAAPSGRGGLPRAPAQQMQAPEFGQPAQARHQGPRERPPGRLLSGNGSDVRPGRHGAPARGLAATTRQVEAPISPLGFRQQQASDEATPGAGHRGAATSGVSHGASYWRQPPDGAKPRGNQVLTWPVMVTMPWPMADQALVTPTGGEMKDFIVPAQEMHRFVPAGGLRGSRGQGSLQQLHASGPEAPAGSGPGGAAPGQVPFADMVPSVARNSLIASHFPGHSCQVPCMMLPLEAMIPVEGGYVDQNGFHPVSSGNMRGTGAAMPRMNVAGGWPDSDEVYTD